MITTEKLPEFGNLPVITIGNHCATARISLMGGHLLSYVPADGEELFFLSAKSWLEPGKPIRGGIPVCWPWFSGTAAYGRDHRPPPHGLARLEMWEMLAQYESPNGEYSEVTLGYAPAPGVFWPFPSQLTVRFGVGRRLSIDARTVNCGDQPMILSQALHSYFRIGAINKISITGLEGREYLEKATSFEHPETEQQIGAIAFEREVDRIFDNCSGDVTIIDPVLKRRIGIAKGGSRTYVVWNPWIAKSAGMPDFGEDEFRRMVCVETANTSGDRLTLEPGQSHWLSTSYSVTPL